MGTDTINAECTCRGYDPADPCGHGDTSEGCPRHDPDAQPADLDDLDDGRDHARADCLYPAGCSGCTGR